MPTTLTATLDAVIRHATAIGRLDHALDTLPAEALYHDLCDELRHDRAMHQRRLADLLAQVDPDEEPAISPTT